MSTDHLCEHWHNGLPFARSSASDRHMVCPICNPELVA